MPGQAEDCRVKKGLVPLRLSALTGRPAGIGREVRASGERRVEQIRFPSGEILQALIQLVACAYSQSIYPTAAKSIARSLLCRYWRLAPEVH